MLTSYTRSPANSTEKSLSDWQVWKSSPFNSDSGISPAVPGHCRAPAPQPRGPARRDTRAGKGPSQPRCPHELPVPWGQTAPTPRHTHSPPHTPPMPTAGAQPRPHETRNTRRCLWGSPKPVPAQREGTGWQALGCPFRALRVPGGCGERCRAPVCSHGRAGPGIIFPEGPQGKLHLAQLQDLSDFNIRAGSGAGTWDRHPPCFSPCCAHQGHRGTSRHTSTKSVLSGGFWLI